MAADQASVTIDIGENRQLFTEWVIEVYRKEVDLEEVYSTFEGSAELVQFLMETCVAEGVCGRPELTAIMFATYSEVRPSTLRDKIEDMRIPQESVEDAMELVPDDFGIVTATYYDINPESPEVESELLGIFERLLESSDESLDDAAEDFLELSESVRNLAISKVSSLLFLLHPERYCVVNNRNKDAVELYFDQSIGKRTDSFFDDIEVFRSIRTKFGFDDHFREFDWFCHWSQELSDVSQWYELNDIDDREAWQVDVDPHEEVETRRVWDWWQDGDICAVGPDIGDLAALEAEEIAARLEGATNGPSPEELVQFRDRIQEGDIIVAKHTNVVLGIGVVTGEYTHEGEAPSPVEAPNWRPVRWFTALDIDAAADIFDSYGPTELDSERILAPLGTFERVRDDFDRLTGQEFTDDLVEMESFISELNRQPPIGPDEGSNTTGSVASSNQKLFVQRGHDGPFRQNLGTTLATSISADVRAELRYLIDENEVEDGQWSDLREMLDDENLTAWGAKDGYAETVSQMDSGDLVLFVDEKEVAFCQTVTLVVEDSTQEALRQQLANLLWRDEDFNLIWFSTEPVLTFQNPESGDAREAIESVVQEADPDFAYGDDWFPSQNQNLSRVSTEVLDHFGGASDLVVELTSTDEVEYQGATFLPESKRTGGSLLESLGRVSLDEPQRFIVDVNALRERDFPPVVHEFDDDSTPENADAEPDPRVKYLRLETSNRPASEVIMEADTRGLVLVRDGDELVAQGKLGCVFGKQEDTGESSRTQIKIAPIVDYRELRAQTRLPSDVESSNDDLEVRQDVVAPVTPSTFEDLLGSSLSSELSDSVGSLADRAGLQSDIYLVAGIHLVAGKNLALYGPPGTGKTYSARLLAEEGVGAEMPVVTAHAELTNYDLVGGYAPGNSDRGDSEADGINWQPSAGNLTDAVESCNSRLRKRGDHTWLLIDELNRANLDQAFGDVFTLLDIDYRDSQTLDYAEQSVRMPYSFRLLATMNTSDRAKLFSLGYAFRRRFGFVPVASLLSSSTERPEYPDLRTPDQDVSSRTEIKDLVTGAVRENLTRSRPMVTEPAPVMHPRDSATIDPAFSLPTRVDQALEDIADPSTFGYESNDGIDTTLEIGSYLDENSIVEIGHTLAIDVTQFLAAAHFLTDGNLERRWLDWAVTTQLLPQMDEFLAELREEETIGAVEGTEETRAERFEKVLERLEDYGLPRSASTLQSAREGYQLI